MPTIPQENDNKNKETVKSLIVGVLCHQRLKEFCKDNGYTIRPFVEKIISEALDSRESRN